MPLYNTDFERELQKIWKSNPCYVVKVKIGNFSIHHGSFHSLKKGGLVNDEVCMISYVNSSVSMCMHVDVRMYVLAILFLLCR